jgi:hypothetical protein
MNDSLVSTSPRSQPSSAVSNGKLNLLKNTLFRPNLKPEIKSKREVLINVPSGVVLLEKTWVLCATIQTPKSYKQSKLLINFMN